MTTPVLTVPEVLCVAGKPVGLKAIRLFTRRTESGVGAHIIVAVEREDGVQIEVIREFADITDTIIDHWARVPEVGGAQ